MDDMRMHRQWATRPADERYADLASMYAMLHQTSAQCGKAVLGTESIRIEPVNHGREGLALVGPNNKPAELTHWSMNQISTIAKAPATYLRTLTPQLAADCLNWSMAKQPREDHQLYIRDRNLGTGLGIGQTLTEGYTNDLCVRAITSPGYTRIYTANVVKRLMELQEMHPAWKAPLVYADGDFGGTKTPCVGFAGDRDAYICLVDQEHRITDPTDRQGQGLARGIMVLNSEVGAKRLDLICFLCEYICGNFIIWGFKQIAGISLRHFGDKIRREWSSGIGNAFSDYTKLSAREEEDKILHASQKQLAASKDDVIDLVFSKFGIGRQQATDAYDLAETHGKDPRSAWGMVHGVTRLSQTYKNMDDRIDLDRAAAKLMDF